MRIFNKLRGTQGWLSLYERAVRYRHMRNKEVAEKRVKILTFWKTHGLQATKDAFGTGERTLYRWQAMLEAGGGRLETLDPKSTAPKGKRKRNIPYEIEQYIIQERTHHPRLGKKKLTPLLREQGYTVSESYVGRVLSDLKKQNRIPNPVPLSFYARTGKHHERRMVKRKKIRRSTKRGMELDTIVRFIDGTKRYILTAIDVEKRFAFAGAYTSHSSESAKDFLGKLVTVCPFPITELQTDNGSEFALRFEEGCEKLNLIHFHTYPRTPKMNAHIERFNRTLSEDFVCWYKALLRDDVLAFNEKLVDWLLWYNTVRPHESLGLVSPLRYIVSTLSEEDCQKWWTRTRN
jgi:transposase InsO family protein